MTQVERWDIFELSLEGPQNGNPFTDVRFGARFGHKHRAVEVAGFYDGDGVYRVRFMPDTPGPWSYVTESNRAELNGVAGQFACTEPGPTNHGPVWVNNTYHFAYADGSPYFPIGTTCYVWNHQGDELEEQTLETLEAAPFNKMRMCVFPKHYIFNQNEPVYHAFERTESGEWDYARFNPDFFRHLEKRIGDLRDLSVEADLILFHPYDRWGYATMDAETDDRYLRYLVARLAAYRNVWWSMANEYDLMRAKTMADWDRFFRIVQESDPYRHLRSIHNCRPFYDHAKPWVSHCSIQHHDLGRTTEWRELYGKPVVVDECGYEGDIERRWGNLTSQELVNRFWEGTARGGYVGHGETYVHPQDVLWWSKGGVLHGESPARIAFLRQILEAGPAQGIDPLREGWKIACAGVEGEYYLCYCGGDRQSARWQIDLPEDARYTIEVIDTWEMTVTPLEGTYSGRCEIPLPGKPYVALRIQKVAIQTLLTTQTFGRELTHLPCTGSTNDVAKELAAQGAPEGTVVVADEQTTGRGRMGRRWLAPPGTCLLCSILFRPNLRVDQAQRLTMLCGLAAANAVERTAGLPVALKWPNDLVVKSRGWKKLAGILTETGMTGERVSYVIVGIGINVNVEPEALPTLAPDATSILAETGRRADRARLLAELLAGVERRYEALRAGESPHQEWAARLATLGQSVQAAASGKPLTGVAESVDEDGALLLRTPDGTLHRLVAGDVTLRNP